MPAFDQSMIPVAVSFEKIMSNKNTIEPHPDAIGMEQL
jgi:hypothetical protein